MLHRDYLFSKCAKFSEKIALLTPWSGLRNVSFSGNFVHFLNRWSHGRTMEVLCPMCCEKMSLPELIVFARIDIYFTKCTSASEGLLTTNVRELSRIFQSESSKSPLATMGEHFGRRGETRFHSGFSKIKWKYWK